MNKTITALSLIIVCLIGYMAYYFAFRLPVVKQDAVFTNISERKSVRHFIKDKTVKTTDIDKILRAAMAAPTARNTQPWEFIVINNRETLKNLARKIPNGGKMLADASCAIVVAGNMEKLDGYTNYWTQDTSAATQNILLAVEALNLGAVWIGGYPTEDRVKAISEETSLPEHILPLNIIAIGYPTGEDHPKNKWNPDIIHYNKW